MLLFFSNKLGCFGSILLSIILTVVVLFLIGVF